MQKATVSIKAPIRVYEKMLEIQEKSGGTLAESLQKYIDDLVATIAMVKSEEEKLLKQNKRLREKNEKLKEEVEKWKTMREQEILKK